MVVIGKIWEQILEDFSTSPYLHVGSDNVNANCVSFGTEYENSTDSEKSNYTKQVAGDFMKTLISNLLNTTEKQILLWSDGISDFNVPID